MAQRTTLEIAPRTVTGKATRHLRKQGLIPANIYGHHEESQAVQIEVKNFEHLRRAQGLRSILTLQLPAAAEQMVLIRHVQHNAVSGEILHIDFSRVSMSESIESKIPLHFVGEAPGVKLLGGVLIHLMEALPVECKASDMVDAIEVDISSLSEFDAALHARDIKLPAGYTLAIDADEAIVKISAPRVEPAPAETAAAETPAAPAAGTAE